jgi:ferredoxin
MFCGLCEDACPVDALELTQDFELASYTREGMIWDRETLEKGPQPTVYQKVATSRSQPAEKLVPGQKVRPQRLKPDSKQRTYRSGEPLRHPKSSTRSTLSASCWSSTRVVPTRSPVCPHGQWPHGRSHLFSCGGCLVFGVSSTFGWRR